jgi:GNAT superfamily N-acetyltransferase
MIDDATARPPPPAIRPLRFDEVGAVLRLIRRSVEEGCRHDYDAEQRAAVYVGYAANLFVETIGPFETIVAEDTEDGGRLVGVAQLDPSASRLRALFVDAGCQGRGFGRALLADIEARAVARLCRRLNGAMALNAVPFYTRAGFRPVGGPENLLSAGNVYVPVLRMEKPLRG